MRPPLALLATTLIGAGAFAAVVVDAVDEGCPVTVEAHDLGSDPIRVDWDASATRTSSVVVGVRVPDPWHRLGAGSSTVDPGVIARRTFTVPGPCDVDRQYSIVYTQGATVWSEPYPGATTWTRATSIHVDGWRATRQASGR
jgi:hypothetical protein